VFKRLFWLVVGAGFGFGSSFWVMRAMRQTAARYAPPKVTSDVARSVRGLGADLKTAVEDGRAGMREREAELRAEIGGPR